MRKLQIFLYILAAIFICSPLFVHQWIHGDYARYLWIINQPYPLSQLGSVTYQLVLHSGLILLGVSILLAALGVQFFHVTKKGVSDSVDSYNHQSNISYKMTNFLKKYRQHILIGLSLIVIFCTVLFFVLTPKISDAPVVEENEYLVTDIGDGWSRYTDVPFVFSIEFPSVNGERPFVNVSTSSNYFDSYSVSFKTQQNDIGTFLVMVIPDGFADAKVWFADRQKDNDQFSEYLIERTVEIAGQEALVTYWRETPENESPYEYRPRQTAFSRDGTVYVINTRGMSPLETERIWQSFQFLEPDISNPPALIDGNEYFGSTYYQSDVNDGLKSFTSQRFDIAFNYPAEYALFESELEDGPQAQFSYVAGSILLGLDLPMRQSIVRAQSDFGGGLPGGIVLTFYQLQDQNLSLEQWLRTNPSGNFDPEFDPDAENSLTSTSIAGIPALTYQSNFGMYPTDYVAFTYNDWFVLASSVLETDTDFNQVLSTLEI